MVQEYSFSIDIVYFVYTIIQHHKTKVLNNLKILILNLVSNNYEYNIVIFLTVAIMVEKFFLANSY